MAIERADWRVLRGAVGAFVACLLLSAVMLGASHLFWREMHREYTTEHARFRDASRKYLSVDEEERVIAEHQAAFRDLRERGILGEEHRLSWIEALTRAGEEAAVPDIAYRIDAQRPYAPDPPLDTGAFDVRVSAMHLSLGLLHEGDLARLLSILDRDAEGLYRVAECALTRDAAAGAGAPLAAPRLRAECTLDWFTLGLTGGGRAVP